MKLEIIVSNEKGFTPEWFDHYQFTDDITTARQIVAHLANKYRHIHIIDAKTKKTVK